jgi:hypothetical protein
LGGVELVDNVHNRKPPPSFLASFASILPPGSVIPFVYLIIPGTGNDTGTHTQRTEDEEANKAENPRKCRQVLPAGQAK